MKKILFFLTLMVVANFGFAQPLNDNPCDATLVDLADGNPLINQTNVGTTNFSLFATSCGNEMATENNTIWYKFIPVVNLPGITVDFSNNSFPSGGDVSVRILRNVDCIELTATSLGINSSSCGTANHTIRLLAALNAGEVYTIQLFTATEDAGNFDILFQPLTCGFNDDYQGDQLHTPVNFGVVDNVVCDDFGCNTGASFGQEGIPCFNSVQEPTVWYKFSTGEDVVSVGIAVQSEEILNPHVAVFSDGCTYNEAIDICRTTVDDSGSAGLYFEPLANHEYTIAVSSGSEDTGHFKLCVAVGKEEYVCNKNVSLTVVNTSEGSPLEGPYLPGESVSFEYLIDSFYQVNCNWLMGIVPFFEGGWATSSFLETGEPVISESPTIQLNFHGNWSWWSAADSITYNLDNDILGFSSQQPIETGGWYFMAPSQSYPNPTSLNESWGDGVNCNSIAEKQWLATFTLTVDEEICQNDNQLSVAVIAFGDGEVGAWNSLGCIGELPLVKNSYANCINYVKDASEIGISIYPNPVTDKLHIRNRDNVAIDKVSLYNQMGQIVLQQEWADNAIDVSRLPKGIYFVALENSLEKYWTKVVLE